MTIKPRDLESEDLIRKESENDRSIDNEFEALSETRKVHSTTQLNSDHVLANLNEAQKELITESIFNNDFANNILLRYATVRCIAKWDKKKHNWNFNEDGSVKFYSLEEINPDDAKVCRNNAKRIFDMFMLKINAIAILSRNSKENFMLSKGWFRDKTEEKPIIYGADDRSILQKIKDKFSGEEYEETGI